MIQLLLFFSLLCSCCCASVPREVTEMRDPKTNRKVLFWGDTHLSSEKMLNDTYTHFFKYFKKEEEESSYNIFNIFNFFNKPTSPEKSLFFLYELGAGAWRNHDDECKKNIYAARYEGLLYYLAFLSDSSIHTLRTKNNVSVHLYGADIRPPIPWFNNMTKKDDLLDLNRTLAFYSNEFEKILATLQSGIDHISNEEEKKLCLELYEPIRLVFSAMIDGLKNIHCDCNIDLFHMKFNDVINHCAQHNDTHHEKIRVLLLSLAGVNTLLKNIRILVKSALFNDHAFYNISFICFIDLFDLDYLVKILTFKTNGIVYAGMIHTRNLVRYLEMLGWEKTVLHKFQKEQPCVHDIMYYSDYLLFQIDHDDYGNDALFDKNEIGCYTAAGEECYERVLLL